MGRSSGSRVRAEAVRLLEAGVAGQVFPGAAACVSWIEDGTEHVIDAYAGRIARDEVAVSESTIYDLSGLTRPIVATAALRLAARGELDLDAPVEGILTEVRGGCLRDVPLRALFEHRAGIAHWGGLYLDVPHGHGSAAARRWVVSEAARRKADGTPPHSDLGYLIAGEAMARAAGSVLAEVVAKEALEPLGLAEALVYAGALPSERRATLSQRAAPTERCDWRGELVRGDVHDENATALGGIAGHAGLFGTARDVMRFGRGVLDARMGRSDFLPSKVLRRSLAAPASGPRVCFGWDLKEGSPPPCGRRMSAETFGQLGFTGTSLFCDPGHDVVISLLTNRICPSRANEKIQGFRPAFHDGVMAVLA